MNATKLIKLSPMLMMIAFLAYAGYSIHASAVDPDAGPSALAKEVDGVVQEMRAVSNAIASLPAGSLRDPFQVVAKPVAAEIADETEDDAPLEPASDSLADIVQGLRLDATFLQGREQIAVIDGRIYSRGQHLLDGGENGKSASKLVLVGVLPSKAILHADGRNFVLSYSDQLGSRSDKTRGAGAGAPQAAETAEIDLGGQLALFQKLLNSPLGALARPASASRSRRSRGSRAASATTARTGSP
jgi:hypothetical protein